MVGDRKEEGSIVVNEVSLICLVVNKESLIC